MSCCGRPNVRDKKNGPANYYSKFAYLSGHQKRQYAEISGTKCSTCDALTFSNEQGGCSVCGNPKGAPENKEG